MSILVDTSVWSLHLRRSQDHSHPASDVLRSLITSKSSLCYIGLVYQEILQGIKSDTIRQKIKGQMRSFNYLEVSLDIHDLAATITNQCQRHGVQVAIVDAVIAATALHYEAQLLTTDNDFKHIAKWTDLQLYPWH